MCIRDSDYTKEMVILAFLPEGEKEEIAGLGQYVADEATHTADVSFVVRDAYQNRGIGSELLSYLARLAKRRGLFGFTAEVLVENEPMLHVFEKLLDVDKNVDSGVYSLKMAFICLLYTSDAADDLLCVDLGGRR